MNEIKVKRGSVYKIAFKAKRRDAKRHLLESFQADSLDEAKEYFRRVVSKHYKENVNRMYRFELYTGNWKPILQVEYKKEEIMKALIFAQKKQTKEGKPFNTYLARLTKKDGEEIVVEAKFREECGNPKADKCPMYIEYEKEDANLSEKKEKYIDEVGEEKEVIRRRLWISKYTESEEKYVDHSLDDFED